MGGQRLLAVGPGAIEQCRVEHEERGDLVGALGGGGPGRVIAQPQVPSKPHKMMYRSRHRRRLYVAEPHLGRLSEVSGLGRLVTLAFGLTFAPMTLGTELNR